MYSSRFFPCIRSATSDGAFGAAMSFYGFNERCWSRSRREFCGRPPAEGQGSEGEVGFIVSGDSHIEDVRATNYGYRQGHLHVPGYPMGAPQQQFRPWRPSPQFIRGKPPPRSADHRNWISAPSRPMVGCERFKVLSYNILADYLAVDHQSILYFHIPSNILDWEWRKRRLFIEFGLWSPDIMCLQEVDRFYDLEGELAVRGYTGIWKMRTGNAVDGCAIFWRTNRFQLLHEEHIEYSKLGLRDNVAQICVLESKMQCQAPPLPISSDRSSEASQVVVCNIHVLYNPKRGEIKLGQVRVLLDRAYAVSRAWNDAPVVVCGDFNSTPTSPLYRFIAEQKVNLLGLTRAQISGQYSAILNNQTKYYSSYSARSSGLGYKGRSDDSQRGTYRIEPYHQTFLENSSYGTSAVTLSHGIPQQNDGQISSGVAEVVLGEAENVESQGDKLSSAYSGLGSLSFRTSESCSQQSVNHVSLEDDKNKAEAVKEVGDPMVEIKSTFTSSATLSEHESVHCHNFQNEGSRVGLVPSFQVNKDNFSAKAECLSKSSLPIVQSKLPHPKISDCTLAEEQTLTCAKLEISTVENSQNSSNRSAITEKAGPLSYCHNPCTDNEPALSYLDGWHVKNNLHFISAIEGEKVIDNMNPMEENVKVASDIEDTIRLDGHADIADEVHSSVPSGLEENADSKFFMELLGVEGENQIVEDLDLPNAELQADNLFPSAISASNVKKHFYDPYYWTPMEIETASGKANCTLVEHPLKLRSAYTDVEDYAGTKDSSREPQITSYNWQFMGTVDYIWCSEDLQTIKVLDTIPKHVLQRTPGFPTQKWGSDHLALVCELAFVRKTR